MIAQLTLESKERSSCSLPPDDTIGLFNPKPRVPLRFTTFFAHYSQSFPNLTSRSACVFPIFRIAARHAMRNEGY